MRDYGKVSPLFWVGKTGKALRGKPEAQVVAFYLITSPHAEMTGVFYCPVMYIAHETGMTLEGASKALQSLIDMDFCSFDEDSDTVFVHEMAKFQIGEELKVNDNQVKSVRKAYSSMKGVIKARFYERYKAAFHLEETSPSEAPPKPRTGTGTGTGDIPAAPKPKKPTKTPLPDGFGISDRVRAWAAEKRHTHLDRHLENFLSAVKRNGYTYVDWDEAFMEAIRKDWAKIGAPGLSVVDTRFKGAK